MANGTPQKVMLTKDLTPAGDRAFDRAVQLAEQWHAELVVCHVVGSSAVRPYGMYRRMRTQRPRWIASFTGLGRSSRGHGIPSSATLK
jgi:hypothetical protein